jgi:hypothetical protein
MLDDLDPGRKCSTSSGRGSEASAGSSDSGSWRVDTLSHDQHQDVAISQEGVVGGSAKREMISALSS